MKPTCLTCNAFEHPLNIEDARPSFGWEGAPAGDGADGRPAPAQTAYRITVARVQGDDGGTEPLWDSGRVESDESQNIPYGGEALAPGARYAWQVQVWTAAGGEGEASEPAFFETGLGQNGWQAEWIGYDEVVGKPFDADAPFYCADDFEDGKNDYYLPPPPYLRTAFTLGGTPRRARLYLSAFGLAEARLNGVPATEDRFVPGLSDYEKTVYSRAFDVTALLKEGENAFGIILADGWYAGYIGLNNREWYGSAPRAMAQLEIEFEDGSRERITTNGGWRASYGPLLESDIFQGESYDATRELTGWSEPGYDDAAWAAVATGAEHPLTPTAHPGVPVVEHERLRPVKTIQLDADTLQLDFGRNAVGVVSLGVAGPAGATLTLRHAEILDESGRLYLKGNRSARCQDSYTLSGRGEERFTPRFTYHAFRFVEISGVAALSKTDAEMVLFGSELPRLTRFTSSSPVVNQLFDMVRNTQRSNQFETPTDCCARDERLGWGMEGNHFAYAMTYLNDNHAFIRKWARDIWDGQLPNGALGAIAPPMLMKDVEQFIGDLQSNHGVYMLHALWRMYGDLTLARAYYDGLEKYFDFLEHNSDRHVRIATSGDWLGIWEATGQSDVHHGYGDCSPAIIGTAHYAIAAGMMAGLCEALGKPERAAHYRGLTEEIRRVFRLHFIQRDGTLRNAKQGELVMALFCGFFEADKAPQAADALRSMLWQNGRVFWRGGTPTTPFFMRVLRRYGMDDLANHFLCQTDYPSIGYMAQNGATAVWERWDAIHEDGTLHPQVMNAHNHIGFTVIAEDLVSGLCGIETTAPGFKTFRLAPRPTREIPSAKACYHSIYGPIESGFEWDNGVLTYECSVPAGTVATLTLPGDAGESDAAVTLPPGRHRFERRLAL